MDRTSKPERIPLGLILVCLLSSWAAGQRLPQIAVPENYRLSFVPDFTAENFAGVETIQIRVLQPTSRLVLNAVEINFQGVNIASGGAIQMARVAIDLADETATLTVDRLLEPGSATVQIRYTGLLSSDLRGFYLGTDRQGQRYAVTQFEPTDARRAFPSFDEPAYKATFEITVVAPDGMVAISNSRVISDSPGPGKGKHSVHFAPSPQMSSYLVAVAVGQFEYLEGSADGIPIRVYTTPGRKQLAGFALDAAENILRYYNRYFAIQYPYGKLDLIALPDFSAGAMENTACITFRESVLLLEEQHSSLDFRKKVTAVIAHEIAHQWFGDLVTMQWWDDVWLNEGFATWMSSKPVEAWKPDWNAQLDRVRDAGEALGVDALANTRSVHQMVETPAEILGLFDEIAYDKAAAVLRMIEAYVGPETFQAGVNQYLREHAYGNAQAEDLWNALARVSKKPVDAIMATFIEQPGAPLVRVTTHCVGGSTAVGLEQQRYFYDGASLDARGHSPARDELWTIPVCIKADVDNRDTGGKACELLDKKHETFTFPGCARWVFANADAGGYYHSGYDPQPERTLAQDAAIRLTPAERILFLGDVWASVRAGREPVADYLELAEGMQGERDSSVMEQLLGPLDYLGATVVDPEDRWAYQLWVRRLLAPAAKDLGLLPTAGESEHQNILRTRVLRSLGATGGEPSVLAEARRWTHEVLEGRVPFDPELAPVFFALAAANGDVALYDKIMADLNAAGTPEEYDLYLRTITRFNSLPLLQRTLDYALSSEVRSQDAARLLAWVIQNPAGRDLAWNFVRAHWSDIAATGGPFANADLIVATGSFCDAAKGDQVRAFFSSQPTLIASRVVKQSLERINDCIDLRTQQESQLAAWLEQHEGVTRDINRRPAGSGAGWVIRGLRQADSMVAPGR
jgi:aminopeptidase N